MLMCFYLPSEYQPEHSHPHKVIWTSGKGSKGRLANGISLRLFKTPIEIPSFQYTARPIKVRLICARQETKPNPEGRHASISAPAPMDDSRVKIITRFSLSNSTSFCFFSFFRLLGLFVSPVTVRGPGRVDILTFSQTIFASGLKLTCTLAPLMDLP